MIAEGSRYTDSPVITETTGSSTRTLLGRNPQSPMKFSFWWYQLTEPDTIHGLAAKNYGDPALWYRIADVNPEVLDWHLIAPGSFIRIPVLL